MMLAFRSALAALGLLVFSGAARADVELDRAVARLASADRKVRQASVVEIQGWLTRQADALKLTPGGDVEELRRQVTRFADEIRANESVFGSRELLGEAVELAAVGSDAEVARRVEAWLRGIDDDRWEEPDPEDEARRDCAFSDFPEQYAATFLVARRPAVARRMLERRDVICRGLILKALSEQRWPEDRALALRFASNSHPALRAAAVMALTHYPVETWRDPVINMAGDRSAQVRKAVASVMDQIAPEVALPTLVKLLDDSYRPVMETAHYVAKDIRAPEIAKAYVRILVKHPAWGDIALDGLEGNPTREAIGPLRDNWAAKEGGWFGIPSVLAKIDPTEARRMALAAARDRDADRRHAGICYLSGAVGDLAEDAILNALLDSDESVASTALEAVKTRKFIGAIPTLREMLRIRRGDREEVQDALNACLGIEKKAKE